MSDPVETETEDGRYKEAEQLVLRFCEMNGLDPEEQCYDWAHGSSIKGKRRYLLLRDAINSLRWFDAIKSLRLENDPANARDRFGKPIERLCER